MKKVSDILDRKGVSVITIDADTTVLDALRLMDDKNIGSVVVTEDGEYLGLLTERDYARKAASGTIIVPESKAGRGRTHRGR